MNHKRRRPKNRRAGCLMCKPSKMNGAKRNAEWQGKKQASANESARNQATEIRVSVWL